ncbi:MAG: hypothetical protein ACRCYU_02030 [Nocardioides sp.]
MNRTRTLLAIALMTVLALFVPAAAQAESPKVSKPTQLGGGYGG